MIHDTSMSHAIWQIPGGVPPEPLTWRGNLYMTISLMTERALSILLFWFIVAACLLIQGCAPPGQPEATANQQPKSAVEAMTADLRQYHDLVVAGWAYRRIKQELQGVDVASIRDRLLSRVSNTTSEEQFAEFLEEFAASLQDGHSQVDISSLKNPLPRTWPVGFGLVKEGIIVVNLNWLPDNPGVKLGDRLIQVNGVPIENLVDRVMQVTSASTEGSRRVLAVDRMHRTAEESIRFTLERADGSQWEVTLPCLAHQVDFRFRERKAFCEHVALDSGIHMIRIPQFTWNEAEFSKATTDSEREVALTEAKTQIDAAFSAAEKAPGLVLDLRGNGGGYELLSSFVAEHLVAGEFLYYSLTRHDSEFVRSMQAYVGYEPSQFGVQLPTRPRQWTSFRHFLGTPFNGRLVVLINQRCFSTTDNLCAFLKDSRPDTRFVGQPTGGGTGEPMIVGTLVNSKVPIQICVSVVHSPNGRIIEGVGTEPDVQIVPTRDEVLQGRDPALEAAVDQFRNW